ncbi:uncharacterized protein [Euwallacea similis]|uniref:uncharacterized protein n=1 Tax=Euwallacea similis TaxID=1736056 RepID=UPI00344C3E4A
MYRQVSIEPKQWALQRILWRKLLLTPIEVFELNTVTYGQASASFLAVKCLHQIAEECELDALLIIKSSFYVDGFLHLGNSIEEGIKISNEPAILGSVSQGSEDFQVLNFNGDNRAKILGLTWQCSSDILSYKIRLSEGGVKVTKRTILSSISQVFDPLSLLSPSIIVAKILIQKLWLEKLSWDDPNKVNIYRHIACLDAVCHELHGFSDASEAAYGSTVYIRSFDRNGDIAMRLLYAKSKGSPLKSLTIPSLELCGALVMARLMSKIRASARLQFARSLKRDVMSGSLSSFELNDTTKTSVRMAQKDSFPDEFDRFSRWVALDPKSKFLRLSSFIDSEGVVRIGGRLRNSPYHYDKKHPLLLSLKHRLSRMLCEHEHKRLMHAVLDLGDNKRYNLE